MSCFMGQTVERERRVEDRSAEREPAEWHTLPEELQLVLAQEAMRRAAATLADQAELLAQEMDIGTLNDEGGPDALRLFATIIRSTNSQGLGPVGHA